MRALEHLKTINHHKKLMMESCFKAGLYKQGILHDMSKYTPSEFIPGVKYYQGYRSPHEGEREDKGYSDAWLHHKGRNKHHLEYWTDYNTNREDKDNVVIGVPMPKKYVLEMVCDRIAASKNYNKDTYTDSMPLEYYQKGRAKVMLHPESKKLLEKYLFMLAKKGEDYTLRYIRNKEVIPMRRERFSKLFRIPIK